MRSMFHAVMSVLFLIAYYLSDRFWVLGFAAYLWALLYVFDFMLALQVMKIKGDDDEDYGSEQDN